MSQFREAFERYIAAVANPLAKLADETQAAETMLASIQTRGQAQWAFDALEDASRTMGSHVADNADGAAYHPWESSGAAYIALSDGFAIFAQWDNSGFWEIDFPTIENAEKEIEVMNQEYAEEEEGSENTDWIDYGEPLR